MLASVTAVVLKKLVLVIIASVVTSVSAVLVILVATFGVCDSGVVSFYV